MFFLEIILLSIVSGILYRFGGAAKTGDRWDFMRQSWIRDCGCSAMTTLGWFLYAQRLHLNFPWWSYVVHFGALWGMVSMYWGFLNHKHKVWWTWLITGIFYGLSAFSFLFGGLSWIPFVIRSVELGVFVMFWRELDWPWLDKVNDAVNDEVGVGVYLPLSLIFIVKWF